MEARRKRKHKIAAWLWLVVLVLLSYLGYQIWQSSNQPYRTQTALPVTMTDSIEVNGVVTRQELVIPQETPGVVGYLVKDVCRVSAGTQVATIFESAQSARSFAQAAEQQADIALLRQAQEDGTNAGTDVNLILKQVSGNLYDYISLLHSGLFSALPEVSNRLSYSLNKLDIAVGREENYDSLLASMEEEQQASAARGTAGTVVSAPQTGFFFYDVDGCEALTPETVLAMTPAQLEQLPGSFDPQPVSAVGKMVTSFSWYYVFTLPAEQAERFYPGQQLELSFTDAGVRDLPVRVEQVGEADEAGRVAVALCCREMESGLSGLRFENAEVKFASYTGIRIARDDLHINSEGQRGVYVKFGTMLQFRTVDELFENEDYILVPLEPGKGEDVNQVCLYDEIVVEGMDLEDGKLL